MKKNFFRAILKIGGLLFRMSRLVKEVNNECCFFLDSEQSECRKSLCECDREMAMGILENEMSWKRQLHERYGFDREKYCSGMAQHDQGFEWQFQQMHDLPGFEKQDTLKLLKSINIYPSA